MHNAALSAIEKLYRANKPIWISRQVIREYISILSRPQTFSQPLTAQTIARRIEFFQRKFNVADDNAEVTEELLKLMKGYKFGGKQIHDANIVATMKAYDISSLLTCNVKDFNKFADLIKIEALS